MYILHKNGLRILIPEAGFKIVDKDKTKVFNREIYLGKYDSINNYIALPINEANELAKKLVAEHKNISEI